MEKIQLESDERILMQVRKHWFVLLSQMSGVIIAGSFPLLGVFILKYTPLREIADITSLVPTSQLIALYAAWLLLQWMALFSIWTNYYLDLWTITNKRLIVVDHRRLFHRTTGSFRLERLQDMNVEVKGIIATLLDFGSLEAETAGGQEETFIGKGLPRPQELKSLILGAADELMGENKRIAQSRNKIPERTDGLS